MAKETKIVITADAARAESAFRSLNSAVDSTSKKMFDLQGLAATLGGALTVTAFAGVVKSAIDLQDEISKLAEKTGTSVEALAGLKYAADLNGASLESVAGAAKKLATNMAETPEVFKKFGITAKDSTGALVQLADIFKGMPDGVDKLALSVKLLGKNGEEMIPFLNQGGEALQKMVEQGKELYPISTENAKAAAAFNDQLDLLKTKAVTASISLANPLVRTLNEVAKKYELAGKAGLSFLESLREISLRSSSDTPREKIKDIDKEIAALEKWIATNDRATDSVVAFQRAEIERKKKAREFYLELERNAALEGAAGSLSYRLEGGASPIVSPSALGKGKELFDALSTKNEPKAPKEKRENTGAQALLSIERDYQNELKKRQDALNAPLLSASERKLADEMRNVSKRAQDSRVDLEKLHISGTLSLENYQARLEDVTKLEEDQTKAIAALAAEQDKLNSSFQYGAQVALRNYMDEIEDVARQSQNLVASAFKEMEDALVQFVRTGKLDFSSLADSIISNLLRISLQQQVLGPLANMLGLSLAGGGPPTVGANAGQAGGNIYANGGAFDTGGAIKFASGGIFDRPTAFKFANGGSFGLGIMGEAGPEAVMPLSRDAQGRLGVKSSGSDGNLVYAPTIHIDSRTDQSEVSRLVQRAVDQGNEALLEKLRRQRQIA